MDTSSLPQAKRDGQSIWSTSLPEDYRLDDVQRLMLSRVEEAFAALWPSQQTPPFALLLVQMAVVELLDYTVRTERGRSRMRKRLTARWSCDMTDPVMPLGYFDNPDLTSNAVAAAVIPGLLAALQGVCSDLTADGMADAVDAWLAGSM